MSPNSMAVDTPAACANCGTALTGSFCARCGQKAVPRDLTVREFLNETTHELTHWDGKVPATLVALFTRPGLLTEDFLAGRRARWLSPLRVYLICSLAFFAGKPLIEAVAPRTPREIAQVTLKDDPGPLTDEERRRIAEGLPGRLFGVDRLERAATNPAQLNREIDAAFPQAMFVLLPVFALLTKMAWRRARPHYPAHLYAALHLHAVWFGASLLFWILVGFGPEAAVPVIPAVFFGYVVWYTVATLHRVFGESWRRTVVKTLLVGIVYGVCLGSVAMMLLLYAVTRM